MSASTLELPRSPAGILLALVGALVVVDAVALATAPGAAVGAPLRAALAIGSVAALLLSWYVAALRDLRYFAAALALLPVVWLYALTGLLLPWDQTAFWAGTRTLDVLLAVPTVGEPLANALFGGETLSQQSHALATQYHAALLALAGASVAAGATRRWKPRNSA